MPITELHLPICRCGQSLCSTSKLRRCDDAWEIHIASEIADLISRGFCSPSKIPFSSLIKETVEPLFASHSAAAKHFGFHPNYLYQAPGIRRTTLRNLCRLAAGMSLHLSDLVFASTDSLKPVLTTVPTIPSFKRRIRHSSRQLELQLSASLEQDGPPSSIRATAAKISASRTTIQKHCPDKFRRIRFKYLAHRSKKAINSRVKIRKAIRMLMDGEKNDLSAWSVIRRLGFVRSYEEMHSIIDEVYPQP